MAFWLLPKLETIVKIFCYAILMSFIVVKTETINEQYLGMEKYFVNIGSNKFYNLQSRTLLSLLLSKGV